MSKQACLVIVALLVTVLVSCGRQDAVPESPELRAQAEQFVELLAQEDFQSAVASFDSTMTDAMPADKLREAWGTLVAESGAFQRRAAVRTEKIQQYDVVFVTCEFERRAVDIKVVLDSAGQISGLWFAPPQRSGE